MCLISDPRLDGPGTADTGTELIGQLDAERVTGEHGRATAKRHEIQLMTLRSLKPMWIVVCAFSICGLTGCRFADCGLALVTIVIPDQRHPKRGSTARWRGR